MKLHETLTFPRSRFLTHVHLEILAFAQLTIFKT